MKKKNIFLLFLLAIITILIATYFSYTNKGIVYALATNDISSIVKDIQSFGNWAAIALFLLVVIEVVAAPVPPLILYIAGGIIFGGFFGGIIVLAGNIIGSTIAFLFARKVGKGYMAKKIGKENSERFGRITEKYGPFAIFILRINPLTSSDLVSYFAGLSKMRLSHFIISTALGLIPLVFSQTYLGSDIIKQNSFLLTLLIWMGIAYGVFILFLLLKLIRKKEATRKDLKSEKRH
jgi:uncharacterized membrane protein YdjX (TVP38/TMEM64 family)